MLVSIPDPTIYAGNDFFVNTGYMTAHTELAKSRNGAYPLLVKTTRACHMTFT